MDDPGRVEARLDNIRAVDPILSALRTVSQGSMHAARKRLYAVERYSKELLALRGWLPSGSAPIAAAAPDAPVLILALGSDRGLCGRFNHDVAARVQGLQTVWEEDGTQVAVWSLGLRLAVRLEETGQPPEKQGRFAHRALPAFESATGLAASLQQEIESGGLRSVHLVHNQPLRAGLVRTTDRHWLPLQLAETEVGETSWPPPILETDPQNLLRQIRMQAAANQLYAAMLASSAAEHAARYHLLEDAGQNTERLMAELQIAVQQARQQAITAEMQELAAGASLK
ncbi:MAG: F0F1 ATP synthase subunit gamma [Anaerolineales bacterium]|nr:F0F1 ATP synthase subunit gamma [Anaerolineales bacterium]